MVVVFLDGVDGTGKTTLLRHIAEQLPNHLVTVAPPLWRYLPAVPRPEAFASWVTTTDPADVAVELLIAQRHRIEAIHPTASAAPALTVLVDRGPKTVEASARAHLTNGEPQGLPWATSVAQNTVRLRAAARRLAASHPCLAIELAVERYEDIIGRLTPSERIDPVYLRYLHAFLDEFQASDNVAAVPRRVLIATDELAQNTAAGLQARCEASRE